MQKHRSSANRIIALLLTLTMSFNLTLFPMTLSAEASFHDYEIVMEEIFVQVETTTSAAYELAALDAPSFSLNLTIPVANAAEVIALLPKAATITTFPPSEREPLQIYWELDPFIPPDAFNPSPGALNSFRWSVTLPPDVTNSAMISDRGWTHAINYTPALPFELVALDVPSFFWGFPVPVANMAEAIALLPATAAITTYPPSERDPLQIYWEFDQLSSSDVFNPSPGAFNYFRWSVTLPPDVMSSAMISDRGWTLTVNYTPALPIAQSIAQSTVNIFPASNETTEADIITAVEDAIASLKEPITASWYVDFNLTPASKTSTGTITGTIRLTQGVEHRDVTVYLTIDKIKNVPFLEWNYHILFNPPTLDNNWRATSGSSLAVPLTNLEFFYADGSRATLGRAFNDRLSINVPNSTGRWFPLNTGNINANTSSGWIITLSTVGWENIKFSARQASSNSGPARFGLAYRIGTEGEWTGFGDGSWSRVTMLGDAEGWNYPNIDPPGVTFENVPMPDAIANQLVVQIKIYIATTETRNWGTNLNPTSGNTSINNIEFIGDEIGTDGDIDTTALEAIISQAESLNEDDYNPASWANFQTELAAANALLKNAAATQQEINKAVFRMFNSIDTLVCSSVVFIPLMLGLVPGSTTDSINITWHDYTSEFNENTPSLVKFAPVTDMSGNRFPENAIVATAERMSAYTGRTSFQATVNGLTPGVEYVYAVSSNGVIFSEHYTYLVPAAGAFRFAVIGDIHMGDPSVTPTSSGSGNGGRLDGRYRPGITVAQGWQDTLDVIADHIPNLGFIISTGDNIDRNLIVGSPENSLDPHQIKWSNFFAPDILRNIPFASAMGNHEARSNFSFRTHFNLPNERVLTGADMLMTGGWGVQQENENRANYFYLYNNALFVVLNTAPRLNDSHNNPGEDAFIAAIVNSFDEILTAAKATHYGEYDWLFVKTHKGVSGISDHSADFDIERYVRQGLESLMIRHGVDVYLSGHDHHYTRSFPAQLNEGTDNFGEGIPRAEFRMNNITYDYTNNGNEIKQGDGTVFFTMNSAVGQQFYSSFRPDVMNNHNFPYLYDGTRGSMHLTNMKLPWNVAFYRQEYRPMFMEVRVNACAVTINAVQFDHSIDENNPIVEIVDNLTIARCDGCENCPLCECGLPECELCNPPPKNVTFDLQGGTFTTTPPALTVTYGNAVGILPSMPTYAVPDGISKEGYRFTGWFEYVDGEYIRRRDDFIVTRNVELIATWEKITDPINFQVGSVRSTGRITSVDATMIARWLIGHNVEGFCHLAADIDGNGEITATDVTLLARWLVGNDACQSVAH
ncbi:MAG: metallophosphoesterase [Defluviitaleaceae bacterium]|nr:metallophosphoesterase [Defluviitaleaceae bacterium]